MDEAIAYGATIKASQLSGQSKENRDVLLQDVTPLSLGIEDVYNEMGVIVPRNSQVPLKMTYPAVPNFAGQSNVIIDIYQGEERRATLNHKVGGFEMKVANRRDLVLEVTFEIDDSGLLTVTAKDPQTNQSANIKITSDKLNLTQNEITQMRKEAQQQGKLYQKKEAVVKLDIERELLNQERAQKGLPPLKNKDKDGCTIF